MCNDMSTHTVHNEFQKENHQHSERLRLITEELTNIQTRHSNMQSELLQLRRRQTGLQHRIIAVSQQSIAGRI